MTTEEFKAEIEPHYRLMYRVAASVLKSDYEAADAVHDAVLKLFEKPDRLKDVPDVKRYCLSAVRNTCLNIIRDRKYYFEIDEVANIVSDENTSTILEYKNLSDCIAKAMECLPVDQKRVFQLSAFGGFSNAEIADLLGITQGNVRVILSRARNKIKVLISK